MLLALIFIGLVFFPIAIIAPPESVSNPIVTAVGIDKVDDEYEVTLLTFLSYPNQSYSESYQAYTCTGKTLSDALTKAGLQIGKSISLFHVHTAVVSEKLLQEDITPSLDYLIRVASLPQSCVLLATNVGTKEFIEFIKELDSQSDINLEELSFYNSNYVTWEDSTINAFMQSYYSPTRSIMMSYFPIVEGDIDGISLSQASQSSGGGGGGSANGGGGGSSGGGSSGSSSGDSESSQSKKELINDGSELIVKDGKKVDIISSDFLRGVNWFNSHTIGSILTLDDITDENFTHSQLIFRVNKKHIQQFLEYENGTPVYNASIKLYVSLIEVDGDKNDRSKKFESSYISPQIREKVEEFVKKDVQMVLEKLVKDKTDILEIYSKFYSKKRAETKKFVKTLDHVDDFLGKVAFKFTVTVLPN